MVCTGPITDQPITDPTEVMVVPEGKPTWGREEDRWARAYAFIDQPLPEARVKLMRGKRRDYLPYYNAGFISFGDGPVEGPDGDQPFARRWLDLASEFDRKCPVGGKRPWLDQITLPLAIAKHGLATRVLEDSYNFSVSHRFVGEDLNRLRMVHYHRAVFFRDLPIAQDCLSAVIDQTPERHRDGIAALLRTHFEAKEPEAS